MNMLVIMLSHLSFDLGFKKGLQYERHTDYSGLILTNFSMVNSSEFDNYRYQGMELRVPQNHTIMISSQKFKNAVMKIFHKGKAKTFFPSTVRSQLPDVFEAEKITVNLKIPKYILFNRYELETTRGVYMLVSFHNVSHVPVRLSSGQWVCNDSVYTLFRQHVMCNVLKECVGGEDEHGQCPFSGDHCPRGGIPALHTCLYYVVPDPSVLMTQQYRHGFVIQ